MQKSVNTQWNVDNDLSSQLTTFTNELLEKALQIEAESVVSADIMREAVAQIDSLQTTIQSENELRQALADLGEAWRHQAQEYPAEADSNPEKASESLAKEAGLGYVLDIFNQYVISANDYYNQGHSLLLQALEAFQKSVSIQEHAKTCERIATTLKALGLDNDALKNMERAYELNPKNSKTATLYAEMLHLSGKNNEAIAVLKAVLERHTTYKPAKRLLEIIERTNS